MAIMGGGVQDINHAYVVNRAQRMAESKLDFFFNELPWT